MNDTNSKCDGCAKDLTISRITEMPLRGMVFDLNSTGHYGGFTDFLGNGKVFTLCHDCSLRLLTALPVIAEALPKGLHPSDTDDPCCEYAWRTDENHTYVVYDGKWVAD